MYDFQIKGSSMGHKGTQSQHDGASHVWLGDSGLKIGLCLLVAVWPWAWPWFLQGPRPPLYHKRDLRSCLVQWGFSERAHRELWAQYQPGGNAWGPWS